ncbi:MAG: hypothetical protein JW999_10510 [Methanotrichaceae archaeon]|nr:hypothetical protein [Methanotrichaceae archaeon]
MLTRFIRPSLLSAAILLMLLISFADAFSLDMPGIQNDVTNYNSKIDNAPSILKNLLGSEKINLIITRDNGSVFRVGMDVVSARIERTVEGGYNNSTILITTTEGAMNEVVRSEDRIAAFQNLTNEGQIRFEAKSWLAEAKLKAALSSTSVLRFGYSLFFS